MPARFRILAAARPAQAGAPVGAGGPLVEREVEVGADVIRLGRRADLELPLPFAALSAVHARVRRDGAGWAVEDAASTNGTWLGGDRLAPGEWRPLAAGAELRLANVRVVFEGEGALAGAPEGTGTIARRLVDDLFGGGAGTVPAVRVVGGAAPERLALVHAGRAYVVGRSEACALPLPVEEVSREHAALLRDAEGVVVRDLGSKNGVSVGGTRVDGERRLADGELVRVGPVTLAFEDPAERYLRELADVAPVAPVVETPAQPPPPEVAPVATTDPGLGSRLAIGVGITILLLITGLFLAMLITGPG
jgi:pSer/pThr/pTyr-binding forkhead associated (FHA) protein